MQNFKVINPIGSNVKIEIEGYGTVAQIELAQKLFNEGLINWKCRMESTRVRLSDDLINTAINKLNFYPKEF